MRPALVFVAAFAAGAALGFLYDALAQLDEALAQMEDL